MRDQQMLIAYVASGSTERRLRAVARIRSNHAKAARS